MELRNISIKIQGFRLPLSEHVKYLGIFIDDTLSWSKQIRELGLKLSKANGILSKLRHYVPQSTLISVYYAIFYSHMNYCSVAWSLTTQSNLERINILQKKCIRIINFLGFRDHTNSFFFRNKITKFYDVIESNQIFLAWQFNRNMVPKDINDLFVLTQTYTIITQEQILLLHYIFQLSNLQNMADNH